MSPRWPGFLPGPGMAVYYATKAYVLSFSEALQQRTQGPRRAGDRALPGSGADRICGARRHRRQLGAAILAQPAEHVAEAGYHGLMRGQRVVIPGLVNK